MNSKTLCIHWISGTKQRIYASVSFRCAFVAVTVFVSQNVPVCVSFKVRNVFLQFEEWAWVRPFGSGNDLLFFRMFFLLSHAM